MEQKNIMFSLDIGTRSVVGIIMEVKEGNYYIKDTVIKEHQERAMLDGQIHDVMSVSKIIKEIKEELEKTHGPLRRVCVAAAGRALRTERSKATISIKNKPILQKDDILHLELSAVQAAQVRAAENFVQDSSKHYYCVGYSVLHYYLDDEEIGNLIDQRGDTASVEIIATFLPRVVVESLITALQRAELEMEALTLEPIAAINVLIPPSMRRLNVALVDIGAGTSDIAITDEGTVIAYGMVPVAGDEITEAISDQYLLDFPKAEQAKRELIAKDSITITDILGFETTIPKEEVIQQISPSIEKLAKSICEEILRLNNNKPPKAVMLVGGGSLTPHLPKTIAQQLQLPENRVAIRGTEAIQQLVMENDLPKGPEFVTPIGIAIAAQQSPVQYVTVYVNDQPVRVFEVKSLTIGDCVLTAGLKVSKLYGKPGMASIITVNGQSLTLPGEHGHPPTILLNGTKASFDTPVKNGDKITIIPGIDGRSARVTLNDLFDETFAAKTVTIQGKPYTIHPVIEVNGRKASLDQVLVDKDVVEVRFPKTIEQLLDQLQLTQLKEKIRPFYVQWNGKATFFPKFSGQLLLNDRQVKPSSPFQDGDVIEIVPYQHPTLSEILQTKQLNMKHTIVVLFNGERVTLEQQIVSVIRDGKQLTGEERMYIGDSLQIDILPTKPFIFQDLFRYVEVNRPSTEQRSFTILKNGVECTFYEPIQHGDELELKWKSTKTT